jgi:hypothetical protein
VAGSSLVIASGTATAAAPCGSSGTYAQAGTTATCTYTGAGTEDTFAVPAGVSSLNVTAIGAPGGSGASQDNSGPGGKGAVVTNPALAAQAGATLYVDVGAPGTNHSDNEALCTSSAPGGLRDGGRRTGLRQRVRRRWWRRLLRSQQRTADRRGRGHADWQRAGPATDRGRRWRRRRRHVGQ